METLSKSRGNARIFWSEVYSNQLQENINDILSIKTYLALMTYKLGVKQFDMVFEIISLLAEILFTFHIY